ncbi:sulfatase [Niabella sp. CC-SYL272]|uniref:sulfatase n=1 Tax=Niabella agricola TaxID=2891571 RepID=UPI001F4261C6|nr:sulfatase [Niabella agricola]MCF3109191.1 sulfatase [Niabella agricola]
MHFSRLKRHMIFFSLLLSLYTEAQQRPNIIFILADDLGYSELGSYGNTFNETPALDRLATEGMRFSCFYAAAPVCSPYRVALMTGQYPARVGITDYLRPRAARHLDTGYVTLPELLKMQGYHTGIVGKWHLSGYVKEGAPEETLPDRHGFDEVLVSENRGIGEGTYFYPYDFNREIVKRLPGTHEYITDRQNLEALEFIKRNRNQPFFLFLSHYAVHTTVHGKPELVRHFQRKKNAGASPPSQQNPENAPYKKWPSGSKATRNNPHLAAQLKGIDDGVGAIVHLLKELQIDRNTLIIFTSDNGGETTITTNAPLRGGKSTLYEGGIREPFIAWWPGKIQANAICKQPLASYDIYPTLAALTGAKGRHQPLDGISFSSLLQNPEGSLPQRDFYWHYPLEKPHFLGGRSAGSIRSGAWKLITFFDDGHKELYNLDEDPGEKTDLAAVYPSRVAALDATLQQWQQSVNATH